MYGKEVAQSVIFEIRFYVKHKLKLFFLKDSEWVLTDIPLESTLNFQVVVEGINTNANFVYLKLILFG